VEGQKDFRRYSPCASYFVLQAFLLFSRSNHLTADAQMTIDCEQAVKIVKECIKEKGISRETYEKLDMHEKGVTAMLHNLLSKIYFQQKNANKGTAFMHQSAAHLPGSKEAVGFKGSVDMSFYHSTD